MHVENVRMTSEESEKRIIGKKNSNVHISDKTIS